MYTFTLKTFGACDVRSLSLENAQISALTVARKAAMSPTAMFDLLIELDGRGFMRFCHGRTYPNKPKKVFALTLTQDGHTRTLAKSRAKALELFEEFWSNDESGHPVGLGRLGL